MSERLCLEQTHILNCWVEDDTLGLYIKVDRYMPDGPELVASLGPFTQLEFEAISLYLKSQADFRRKKSEEKA